MMKRMPTRKSHSWWWDSHISPKNSKWLAENLEEMNRLVKEMLKLIEEEGDSFAKKAEMYYERRPELVSHVEDFYRMYRALAERYSHVTGELRNTIPSELHSQGPANGNKSSSGPPSPSLLQSSESTLEHGNKGSGGSSSSESDSDSDFLREVIVEDLSNGLHQRIAELEQELPDVREKLREYEKDSDGQCEHLENAYSIDLSSNVAALEQELAATNEKLFAKEFEIISLQEKLKEDNISLEAAHIELGLERKNAYELELKITSFETKVLNYNQEIENLKAAVAVASGQYESDLLNRDQAIDENKRELESVSERYLQEKSSLESDAVNLELAIRDLKENLMTISEEKSQLEAKVVEQEHLIQELKVVAANSAERFFHEKSVLAGQVFALSQSYVHFTVKVRHLEDEKEELNRNLEMLNQKCDILSSEKEELSGKVIVLTDDLKNRDDCVCQMTRHLHQLHLENAKLIAAAEETKTVSIELREQIKELEDEVDRQRIMISDGAEGKREAIRQLCFTLEHYRDNYHQLRQVLLRHKRPILL